VIARVWRGWIRAGDADPYERFVRTELFPEVRRLDGFRGAHILRRPQPTTRSSRDGDALRVT
jgi:hypothetical protein